MTANPALTRARQDDTERRRQRVLDALRSITGSATEPTVSAVATVARVHRSLIYRHPDLHAAVLAQLAQPRPAEPRSAATRCWPTWPTRPPLARTW